MRLAAFLPDRFVTALLTAIAAAALFPLGDGAARLLGQVSTIAVALLFFLHGARLPTSSVRAGLMHWRLQLAVIAATFALFPLIGLALGPLLRGWLPDWTYLGLVFLCALPSTVQSSIGLVAVARGNVPAAVCGASVSNLLGVVATPLLIGLLASNLAGEGLLSWDAFGRVVLLLLVPFAAGQLARRWIGATVERRKSALKLYDQGSIVLVVYVAFANATRSGLWQQVDGVTLAALLAISLLLLLAVIGLLIALSRRLGFSREDESALLFCGSQKSLASGVPLANILLPAAAVGTALLPLMLYHQLQLIVCAMLAQRYARRHAARPTVA